MRMHARIHKETNKYKRTRIHEEICLYNYVCIYIYTHSFPRVEISSRSTYGAQIPEKKVSRLETRFQSGEKRRKGVEAQTV